MKRLIIGFPGLTHQDEEGRLEEIAGHFPDYDFKKIKYPEISKNGKIITIPFSLENFSQEVEIPTNYNQIGVIASSTGAAVFSHYISANQKSLPNWYVSISPFCKLNSLARNQVEKLNELKQDLEIEQNTNTRRIIPHEYIPNLLALDINSQNSGFQISSVLTLLGTQDTIIDLSEAKKHNYKMGGQKKDIKMYEAAHALNPQSTQDAIKFIKKFSH